MTCSVVVVITSIILLAAETRSDTNNDENEQVQKSKVEDNSESSDGLMYGAKFWLCVHVGCGLALSLHTRGFADQRFSFTDRLFYSYAFSLVVLLPARYRLLRHYFNSKLSIAVSFVHLIF